MRIIPLCLLKTSVAAWTRFEPVVDEAMIQYTSIKHELEVFCTILHLAVNEFKAF